MSVWTRFLPRRRIGVRLVAAVSLSMAAVLLLTGAFVYWRVAYALDRQVDEDLKAYAEVVEHAVRAGAALPRDTPGQVSVVYDDTGAVVAASQDTAPDLAAQSVIRRALAGHGSTYDIGHLLVPRGGSYSVRVFRVPGPHGVRVVAAAISQRHHDEALRELLVQLVIADLLAIAAAVLVGIGVARAALGPVEDYRRAVVRFGDDPAGRLPVDEAKDDELSRLGHTFNDLLDRLAAGHERERGFLADASHELRSPLAMLATEVEWARHRHRSAEEMTEVLDSISTEVTRLVSLSDALLDLEELRAEDVRREPTVLSSLVEDVVAAHGRSAREAGRTIVADVPEATVRVDARRVDLALRNLVGNALKYGRGTITVHAEVDDDLRIRVTDEGPGVDPQLGARAFDRFTRADRSRTTRGSGLGLALVLAVAQSHGGTARLVPGGVELLLPAQAAAGSER